MYRLFVRRAVPTVLLQLTRGRTWLTRLAFAPDAEFIFPGRHSYAAQYNSRAPIEAWLRDFAALRPDYRIRDILVDGPPWNTRVAVRFTDSIAPDYTNEGMHYLRLRWGRVVHEQVFLDTQLITDWEARHPQVRRQQRNPLKS